MNKKLAKLSACSSAIRWVKDKDLREAWNECERGDWMLWIARRRNVDIKTLTMAKVKCVRLVQHLMRDERSLRALNIAEKFALGDATREELDAAAAAAAAAAAYATADAAAAYVAAAAYATADAAAAYAAADAAAYTAYAADAADAAARKGTLSKTADICREIISFDDLKMDEVEE